MRKIAVVVCSMLLTASALASASMGKLEVAFGLTPTGGHTVTLQGCTSTTPNVGYYFYRGSTSGAESATALNSTPAAACTYTDATVLGNTTYFYYAKAYSATSTPPGLSTPSNEVMAVVPGDPPPNAPTGLQLGTVAKNSVPLFWNHPAPQGAYAVIAFEVMRGSKNSLPNPVTLAIVPSSQVAWNDATCKQTCFYAVRSLTIHNFATLAPSGNSNIVMASF